MVRATVINDKSLPGPVFNEEELKKIFKQHDANRDGLLSKAELKNAFKSLGALIPSLRAFLGLYHADANGDGFIGEE
jgi:Ca2+-binding EF-hand superfamily protein